MEKAIRDANSWVRVGEGVGLCYYHEESYGDQASVAVINRVLDHESPFGTC